MSSKATDQHSTTPVDQPRPISTWRTAAIFVDESIAASWSRVGMSRMPRARLGAGPPSAVTRDERWP